LNLVPGIYVCELEAYPELPVRQIEQLMVEPETTKVFKDKLIPTLMVSETKWAEEKCTVQQNGEYIRLENGFIGLHLKIKPYLKEMRLENKVCGIKEELNNSMAFKLLVDEEELLPEDFKVDEVDIDNIEDGRRIRIILNNRRLKTSVIYQLKQKDHFYHKWLIIENKTDRNTIREWWIF